MRSRNDEVVLMPIYVFRHMTAIIEVQHHFTRFVLTTVIDAMLAQLKSFFP